MNGGRITIECGHPRKSISGGMKPPRPGRGGLIASVRRIPDDGEDLVVVLTSGAA